MTEIREVISCRSMAFPEQRKAYMLRYIMRLSWEKIAEQVVNLRGGHPSWVCVKETVQRMCFASFMLCALHVRRHALDGLEARACA